jgi:hypothetical protein
MRLVTLASVLLLAAGCATEGAGAEDLSRQAQTLVPESAEVVDISEGACVQIERNPACARIFLTLDGSEDERADELVRTAEAAGWEVANRAARGGGPALARAPRGYRAIAAVWTTTCPADDVDEACADEIQVIEDPSAG